MLEKSTKESTNVRRKGLFVGMDIGGTKTEVLVVDQAMQQQSRFKQPTDTRSPYDLVDAITKTVDQALSEANGHREDIIGVGIAVPGLVDRCLGEVRLAVNLNLKSFPLGPVLSAKFNAPTYLENDVRLAALGAYQIIRQEQSIKHLAYLGIGTGIAAGIIINGRIYRGSNGMAGEIGHVVFKAHGPLCACGIHGCLEALASGTAIARLASEQMSLNDTGKPLTAEDVYEAAGQGHLIASRIIDQISPYIARAIQLLTMTYDVDKVILGGGVTRAGSAFLTPILRDLSLLRAQSELADMMLSDDKVMLLPATYNAGAWGAILLANTTDNGYFTH